MAKSDEQAFNNLKNLIDGLKDNRIVQIEKRKNDYEVTVFRPGITNDHTHYQGQTLTEAISRAYKSELGLNKSE